jgi:hypothetical protein
MNTCGGDLPTVSSHILAFMAGESAPKDDKGKVDYSVTHWRQHRLLLAMASGTVLKSRGTSRLWPEVTSDADYSPCSISN